MIGNKRLPGDLLGRWGSLYKRLEEISDELQKDGAFLDVDWSDVVVPNAYLTEDAEFAKWNGDWDATPPATPPATVQPAQGAGSARHQYDRVPTVDEYTREILNSMVDDWLERYEPGAIEWSDAHVIKAWLDNYRGTFYDTQQRRPAGKEAS